MPKFTPPDLFTMRQLLPISFIINCLTLSFSLAQATQINGVVMDSTTRRPVSGANIFVGHTTLRATSNRQGHFSVAQVPLGTVDLIVESSEHRPGRLTTRRTSDSLAQPDTVWLRPIHRQLLDQSLKGYPNTAPKSKPKPSEERDYKRGLTVFLDRFVGTSERALACRIVNPWVLEVQWTKQEKKEFLLVTASEVLGIENPELGYVLHCYIDKFEVRDQVARFWGAVGFAEMVPKNAEQAAEWQARRALAYGGSLTHFLHGLAAGKTEQEGFLVYPVPNQYPYFYSARVPNKEKPLAVASLVDTTAFAFEKKLKLARPGHPYLQANYDLEPEEVLFRKFAKNMANKLELVSEFQPSWLQLSSPEGFAVFNTAGWLCHPHQVDVLGYWEFEGWGDRVPANYVPPKAKKAPGK
jgi:hypothetical protein